MNITREDLPERQVALVLEFDEGELEPALQKTYRKLVNKVNIPGFRPGKAPRHLFERFVGREALVTQAVEDLIPDAIEDAVSRQDLQGASVADVDLESTDPLRVRVLLDQEPLVELGDYSDLRVEREHVEIGDEQVDSLLHNLRRREAVWHPLPEPRPARMGDRVTVDMETFTIDGPVKEMTGEDLTFELTEKSGPAWPIAIDENIAGMSPGEQKDFAITFPDQYVAEEMRGRDATVHVHLKSMEEAELPELDDAFAQRVAQAETMEELRERIKTNMQLEADTKARRQQMDKALQSILERSRIEVPRALVDREVDHRYEHLVADLRERKIQPSRYFSFQGTSEAEWREQQREPARERIRELLALRSFAEREGIVVSEDELAAEIDANVALLDEPDKVDEIRSVLSEEESRERIEARLFDRKLYDRLVEIVEGRAPAAVQPRQPTGSDGQPDPGESPAPTGDAAGPEVSGSVPATEMEPSALEIAGGAAEVLGTGPQDQRRPG